MKIMFHNEEIELKDTLEKGEDLDLFVSDELEDTIEIPNINKLIEDKEIDLSDTQEFGEFNYE